MSKKISLTKTLNQLGRYLMEEAEQSRMSAWQKAPQQIRVSAPKGKPFVDETNKVPSEHSVEATPSVGMTKEDATPESSGISLQDAIVWSEILGKPMCKRRVNRNRSI